MTAENNTLAIKNISYNKKYGHYRFKKSVNGITHSRIFNNLLDAIAYKSSREIFKPII